MRHTRWSAEAWAEVRIEFRKALTPRIRVANPLIWSTGVRALAAGKFSERRGRD
jgi:hypothetical protein